MTTVSTVGQRKGIQSIEVGIAVLECIEQAAGPISLSRIAQSCGMTPSKAHFYLVSLNRVGLVSQDSLGGLYRLGPAALRLGLSALAQCDVLELARGEMARLSALTGDTVFLSVWGHNGATVISRFDGVNVAPLAVRVGAVMPLVPSATGRVFLAWMPRGHTNAILRREKAQTTARARLDRAAINLVIEDVKRDGIALTPGAVAPEMLAIAAPVFDHTQQLQCVLTVTERAQQLDAAGRRSLAEALRRSAVAVSRAAGYGIGPKPTASRL
jgi:DNA-binding IclR family transcriptional regulator